MFKQGDSSSRQKNDGCFSQNVLQQNVRWFLFYYRKVLPRTGLILKPIERPYVPLKSGTRCL